MAYVTRRQIFNAASKMHVQGLAYSHLKFAVTKIQSALGAAQYNQHLGGLDSHVLICNAPRLPIK